MKMASPFSCGCMFGSFGIMSVFIMAPWINLIFRLADLLIVSFVDVFYRVKKIKIHQFYHQI